MGVRRFIRRFKAAKSLLESEKQTVSTVAAKVGYSDIAFFRQFFKRHTGLTPREYREQFGLTYPPAELRGGLS